MLAPLLFQLLVGRTPTDKSHGLRLSYRHSLTEVTVDRSRSDPPARNGPGSAGVQHPPARPSFVDKDEGTDDLLPLAVAKCPRSNGASSVMAGNVWALL